MRTLLLSHHDDVDLYVNRLLKKLYTHLPDDEKELSDWCFKHDIQAKKRSMPYKVTVLEHFLEMYLDKKLPLSIWNLIELSTPALKQEIAEVTSNGVIKHRHDLPIFYIQLPNVEGYYYLTKKELEGVVYAMKNESTNVGLVYAGEPCDIWLMKARKTEGTKFVDYWLK